MTEQTEANKEAIFDAYMEASQALYQETHGFLIEAGQYRDDLTLRTEIRAILDNDARSSMKTAMIREALNAYEEGRNGPA